MSPEAYIEMAHMQATHWWFVARQKILRSQINRLKLPSGATILEIGSGTGANLELLASFGNVVALEMSAEAIALANDSRDRAVQHIAIWQGRCPDDLGALSERFDLICMFDVLEHIEQDNESLTKLALLLKPSGRLLVTVPAYEWMWGPHDVHLHHKRRYTKRSLSVRCTAAGLSISHMTHFNTLLFPLAVLGRMVEKWTGKKTAATATPAEPINGLLTFIFALERHLIARVPLPFGLSLLLLAQPRIKT